MLSIRNELIISILLCPFFTKLKFKRNFTLCTWQQFKGGKDNNGRLRAPSYQWVGVGGGGLVVLFTHLFLLLFGECKRRYKCKNVPRLLSMINFYKQHRVPTCGSNPVINYKIVSTVELQYRKLASQDFSHCYAVHTANMKIISCTQ